MTILADKFLSEVFVFWAGVIASQFGRPRSIGQRRRRGRPRRRHPVIQVVITPGTWKQYLIIFQCTTNEFQGATNEFQGGKI